MNEMKTRPHPTTPARPDLRASDADRDGVARVLANALGDGRLDQQEHAERLEATYAAKTLGDLAPLTRDLGDGPPPAPATAPTPADPGTDRELLASSTGSEHITAICGSAQRHGRWLVEPRTTASAICGSIELDTRQAVMAHNEVTVQVALVLSGVELTVPPGVRVIDHTSGILGGTDAKCARGDTGTAETHDEAAPTIRLTGLCLLSGVKVRTLAPGERS